ncbi:MAG TPA: TetR/AcrR family transcriptional regulator [Burkholderiales bacterium]|nr:TetR/AcrR family transcriptional regulator [Burkholderiales bacterium]
MSTYHHGDLRAALLRAAGKILEEKGIAGLSLREAARQAEVSHNAPYRHFADRESLLAALAAEGFAILSQDLEAAGREMGAAYVGFALQHPQRFRLMFGGLLPIAKYEDLRVSAGRAYQALVELMKSHKEIADPEAAAAAAWSLVHGLSHLLLDGHFAQEQREEFVKQVLGAVRFAAAAQRSA